MTVDCTHVLSAVITERHRQEALRALGKFKWTLADTSAGFTPAEGLAVLSEEHGEIARVVCESLADGAVLDVAHLREELIQLAACCVAWVEGLDSAQRTETTQKWHIVTPCDGARAAFFRGEYDSQDEAQADIDANFNPTWAEVCYAVRPVS